MIPDPGLASPAATPNRAPAVSVVIPAFEVHQYIAQTLNSVFAQTFTDFEVIVVNDGSPSTAALESALAPYRDRIVYITQPNAGASAARNTGVKAARGPWIAFLDGDDWWEPSLLAEHMALLRTAPSVDLVFADARIVGGSDHAGRTLLELFPPVGEVTLETLAAGQCRVVTSTVVVRRSVLFEAGLFDQSVRFCEDFDLWLRVAQRGARIAVQRKVLGNRRIHASNTTADGLKLAEAVLGVLERLARHEGLTPRQQAALQKGIAIVRAEVWLARGKLSLACGDVEAARRAIRSANRDRPSWKLSLALAGLRVMPGVACRIYRARQRLESRQGTNGVRTPTSPA